MNRIVSLIPGFLLCMLSGSLLAQDLYWVEFLDKAGQVSDAESYFDANAVARRMRNGVALDGFSDLPLNPGYVRSVAEQVDSLRYQLRWFNAVSVQATPDQVETLLQLPFVKTIQPFSRPQARLARAAIPPEGFDTLITLVRQQMKLDRLVEQGLTGKGVRIAIFDAGFKEANTHPALQHVFARKGIVATQDFYGGGVNVYRHSRHGTQVMACVAGRYQDRFLGAADEADFLLARIEHERKELAVEEDHWLAAAEWAERSGADIINSSVTYAQPRYTYDDMDGRSSLVSRAARMATQKGVLVICSMGNEGEKDWHYLGAPADVPEVLSVAASMPSLPVRMPFSSFGPNSKDHPKPDIAAPGYVLTTWNGNDFRENAGTSFSAPLVAGLAACLLQKVPSAKQTDLFQWLRMMGHRYPYFDYELGYGVVQVPQIEAPDEEVTPSFAWAFVGDSVVLRFVPKVMADSTDYPEGRVLYYQLETSPGQFAASHTVYIANSTRYYFFRRAKESSGLLRIWFAGYLWEMRLEAMEE